MQINGTVASRLLKPAASRLDGKVRGALDAEAGAARQKCLGNSIGVREQSVDLFRQDVLDSHRVSHDRPKHFVDGRQPDAGWAGGTKGG